MAPAREETVTEIATLPMDVGTALSLQEFTYAWRDDPLTPEKAQSLELLVVRAVQLARGLQTVWFACTRAGGAWETGYYLSRIRAVEFLATTVIDILTRANEILARTQEKHPEWMAPLAAAEVRPNLDAAQEVVTKARELLQWLNREPLPVNEEVIRRSYESLDRGEGEAVSDILARLVNGGPLVKE